MSMLCHGPSPAWLVCYTQAKAELVTLQAIVQAGFRAWTPVERLAVKRRGKRIERERPYFSRYCFAGINPHRHEWQVLLELDGVEDVLQNNGQPSVVPSAWIAALQHAERIGAFDRTTPEPYGFSIGERVRIGEGPYSGFRGLITEFMARLRAARPDKRAKVLFEYMGRMTTLELPIEHLEKVDKSQNV